MKTLLKTLYRHRLTLLLMFLLGLMFWLPRAFGLETFTTTDEVVWLWRSGNFYYALGQRDFAGTFLNFSPGVTTMWVETLAMLKEFPQYRGFGQGMLDKYTLYEKFLLSYGVTPYQILVTSRQLMVLIHTGLFMLGFLFARRLLPLLPVVAGFLLIAFDPGYISLTRLAHLDGPTAAFLFLAVLAILAFVLDGHRYVDLGVSAFAGGWAILSKMSGLFVIPYAGLLLIVDSFFWSKQHLFTYVKKWQRPVGFFIKTSLLWGVLLLLTIWVFFPAMWTNPIYTLYRFTFFAPVTLANNIFEQPGSDKGVVEDQDTPEPLIQQPGAPSFRFLTSPLRQFFAYLWSFIRGASPVTLFGLVAALLAYVFRISVFSEKKHRRVGLWLVVFTLVYTALLSVPTKTSPKYLVPINPVFNLVSGVGWVALASWIASSVRLSWKRMLPTVTLVIIAAAQLWQSLPTYPYYSTYNSPLVAHDSDAWGSGEGLDQAARYLNQKPNAQQMTVLSWYGIGPFSFYFVGNMIPFHLVEEAWGERRISQLSEIDYIVTYANQWVRDIPEGLNAYLADIEPEKSIWLNGQEYARIYAVSSFPEEKFIIK